jgi:hypothetical protein
MSSTKSRWVIAKPTKIVVDPYFSTLTGYQRDADRKRIITNKNHVPLTFMMVPAPLSPYRTTKLESSCPTPPPKPSRPIEAVSSLDRVASLVKESGAQIVIIRELQKSVPILTRDNEAL